jgi:hypothetical protein
MSWFGFTLYDVALLVAFVISATSSISALSRWLKRGLEKLLASSKSTEQEQSSSQSAELSSSQTAARILSYCLPEFKYVTAALFCSALQPFGNLISPVVTGRAVDLVTNASAWKDREFPEGTQSELAIILFSIAALEIFKSAAAYMGDLMKDASERRILTLLQVDHPIVA